MRDWLALRPVVMLLALLAAAGLLLGWAAETEAARYLIPSPDKVAEGLVSALAAQRYTGALNALSQDLQQQVQPEDLRTLVARIEQAHQGISDAHGQAGQAAPAAAHNATASAQVQVKLGDLSEQELTFELVRENGLWKIASLGPLETLAGQ